MIACGHLESRFAAAQGGTSPGEFARPMSRRQITERCELPLPQDPDWHSDSRHQKRVICLDSSLRGESCRAAAAVPFGIAEPPWCWTRKHVHNPVVTQTSQTADPPRAELADANGLLASLVFHHVRPRNRSAADAVQRSRSSQNAQPCPVSVAAPAGRAQFNPRSARPAVIAQTGSPDPVLASIEKLFTELAWRRLRSLAERERP